MLINVLLSVLFSEYLFILGPDWDFRYVKAVSVENVQY